MNLVWVLVVGLVGGVLGELPPPQASYKILMLLPVSSKSHRNVFLPVAEALADRGHKIVMLANHPGVTKHPNIKEIEHGLPYFKDDSHNMFEARKDPAGGLGLFASILPPIAREIYKIPAVKELYEKRKEFDLIILNHMFNEVVYPFVHEVPFITINTPGHDPRQAAVLGNVGNPSYVPNLLKDFPYPMSVWHRFVNTLMHIGIAVHWRNWVTVPPVQKEITAQFPDLPPLLEIERNQSLTLMNTHFSISKTLPLLPSQVEIGAMHCRPSKPLPKDLESWISGAGREGVIYFSLGSVTRGNSMPVQYRDAFVEAFRRLPHRIIFKYEGDLDNVPQNVMLAKWLPQQDILGNENVKVFITHGGLLSMQEAIYHATPLLAVPIFGDQPKNGMFMQNAGIGKMLIWEELTPELIVEALTELTSNIKYKENILKMSKPLRDQLTTPKDRAVFWTEYVIRHGGAPQLRCPAAELSWIEFLMLDVLFCIHVALFIFIFIMRRIWRAISSKLFGSGAGKKKKRD